MLIYGILLNWALISPVEVCLMGIFVSMGSCEIFMSFSLLKPLLLCIWSVEGSCESSIGFYASWIMVDMY